LNLLFAKIRVTHGQTLKVVGDMVGGAGVRVPVAIDGAGGVSY
jgi:hypothetical protein